MITFFTLFKLNEYLITEFGGAGVGFKDENLARSLVETPYQEVFGERLYKNDYERIAFMVFSVVANHVFIDGNKRTGALLLEHLCDYRNIKLDYSDDELIQLILSVAKSECGKKGIENWIRSHQTN